MKARVFVGAAMLLLCACAPTPPLQAPAAPPAPPPPTADQQFASLSARYLSELPSLQPVNATELGDHRFDGKLDDVSAAGWQAKADFAQSYLSALGAIPAAQLSRANQVDALLLRHDLEYERWKFATLESRRQLKTFDKSALLELMDS